MSNEDIADTTRRESMKYVKVPYWLVIKFYFFRLFVVALIWFLYDVSDSAEYSINPLT